MSKPYSFTFRSNYWSTVCRNELSPMKWGKSGGGGGLRWWSVNEKCCWDPPLLCHISFLLDISSGPHTKGKAKCRHMTDVCLSLQFTRQLVQIMLVSLIWSDCLLPGCIGQSCLPYFSLAHRSWSPSSRCDLLSCLSWAQYASFGLLIRAQAHVKQAFRSVACILNYCWSGCCWKQTTWARFHSHGISCKTPHIGLYLKCKFLL